VAQRKHLCLHVLLCGLVEMAPLVPLRFIWFEPKCLPKELKVNLLDRLCAYEPSCCAIVQLLLGAILL